METNFEEYVKNVLQEVIYPIGATYITQDTTNPSTILEFGTWERVEGEVLVGVKDGDADFGTIGNQVGSKQATLTVANLAPHTHATPGGVRYYKSGGEYPWVKDSDYPNTADELFKTNSTGSGTPFSILQPTRVVGYMWIRTA